MEACREHKESLLLDVYGELGFKERAEWGRHLEDCPGCREERRKMLRFLGRIKESTLAPGLSPDKADALSRAVRGRLSGREADPTWWDRMVPFPAHALAAVATACCVLVLSGWLALKWLETPFRGPGNAGEIQLSQTDLEVIRNLELLEELETLRKLVNVVDHNDAISGSPQI
jgi:anti-sigma factor RsiW